jgi:hypothetical protein
MVGGGHVPFPVRGPTTTVLGSVPLRGLRTRSIAFLEGRFFIMHIQEIIVDGFKSYAQRTVIEG